MPSQIIVALTFGTISIIVGSGIYVLTRLCGQLSLVAGAYMAIGACVCSYFARSVESGSDALSGRGFSFIVSLGIAVLVAGFFSVLFSLVTYKFRGPMNVISGITVSAIVLYLLDRIDFLSGSKTAGAAKVIQIGGKELSSESGLLALSFLIAFASIMYVRNISRSPFSRSMRSINELTGKSGNELAATTNAISPLSTIVGANLICGLTAGAAGALYAQYLGTFTVSSINPWIGVFGIIVSIQILMLIIAGGLKNFWPSMLLIGFFGFLTALLVEYADSIDFVDFSDNGDLSPSHVVGILSALLAILVIQVAGNRAKSKL